MPNVREFVVSEIKWVPLPLSVHVNSSRGTHKITGVHKITGILVICLHNHNICNVFWHHVLFACRALDAQFDSIISYPLECFWCPALTLQIEQRASVWHTSNGSDVFVWLPTEFSKSLCYKLLHFLHNRKLARDDSLVILMLPLVFQMVDQTKSL